MMIKKASTIALLVLCLGTSPLFAGTTTAGTWNNTQAVSSTFIQPIGWFFTPFSVLVSTSEEGAGGGGAYLVSAFNSCRFFAFCERAFFSTPYHHGDARISASLPV